MTRDPVTQFRDALAQDAFALYCQPIAALGGLVRAYPIGEALIRMREEERALLPPGDFLPILEHYGLMPELDRWVVRQVLKHAARGSRIPRFGVNLSGQTVADHTFPAFVAEELFAAHMPGHCLLFEIEEADALALNACTPRFAAMVGSLGVGIVIDGFGRAAESLELLEAPCLEMVKLHGSLTRRLLSHPKDSAEAFAVLGAARSCGIRVIAECVEELDGCPRLQSLGVGYAQGFGVYRPQPIEAFIEPHALLVA